MCWLGLGSTSLVTVTVYILGSLMINQLKTNWIEVTVLHLVFNLTSDWKQQQQTWRLKTFITATCYESCLESHREESDLKIYSDDSFNEDSLKKFNLPVIIKSFDEKQAVFRDSVFLLLYLLITSGRIFFKPSKSQLLQISTYKYIWNMFTVTLIYIYIYIKVTVKMFHMYLYVLICNNCDFVSHEELL